MNTTTPSTSMHDENTTDSAVTMALLAEGLRPENLPPQQSNGLRSRLQNRASTSVAKHRGFHTVRKSDQTWQALGKGVRACVLHDNGTVRSALVEFDPGTRLPSHRHLAHEECMVLRGSLSTGDLLVRAQDYHLAPSGSKHPSIGSEEGALIFLRGTSIGSGMRMMRELVSACLPGNGAMPTTVRASDDNWRKLGNGVCVKPLWINGNSASLLVNVEPGGRLPGHTRVQDEECLAVTGEVFVGDVLLRGGEYQMAPRATSTDEITSDVGGLLFVHTTTDFMKLS